MTSTMSLAVTVVKADVAVSAAPAPTVSLRDYQHDFVDKVRIEYRNGHKAVLLVAATGAGKTVGVDGAVLRDVTERRLAGAALDALDPEPLPADHPLWRAPNIIITPHIADESDLPDDNKLSILRENLRRYVAGEKLLSVVGLERGY